MFHSVVFYSFSLISYYSSATGIASFSDVIPDTITTWTAEAVAVSPQEGLGISEEMLLTVKKQLFVSLELPYSINWGETLKLTPLIFNLQRQPTVASVTISVDTHQELSIVEPFHPTTLSVWVGLSMLLYVLLCMFFVGQAIS